MTHCATVSADHRVPVIDRLRAEIGPDLTRLLLVALAGDHRARTSLVAA